MLVIIDKAVFALFSFAIAAADIRKGEVPRVAFLIAFPVFFVLCLLQHELYPVYLSFSGAILALVVFTIAYFMSGKKLGLADIWYSCLTGLVLGPVWWYPATGIACLTGAIWIIAAKKQRIPFIPCMAAGGVSVSFLRGCFQ